MCPKDEILSAYVDGEIGSPWDKRLKAHIKQCARCRQQVEQYRELSGLLSKDTVSVKNAMNRVKKRIDATIASRDEDYFSKKAVHSGHISFWRRQVMVPMPVLAAGFSVLFVLVASLFFFLGRNDTQNGRTVAEKDTRQPNVQVYYQTDNPELLRKILNDKQYNEETVIDLPQENNFTVIGEPEVKRLVNSKGN